MQKGWCVSGAWRPGESDWWTAGLGCHGFTVQVKDKQPLLTPEDCILAEDIAKADPEVAAMVKEAYGITDLSLLACDPWSGKI